MLFHYLKDKIKKLQANLISNQLDAAVMQPLVSVVAISYNQSEWVIEALNSVFSQDYKNIELIISDDGSTDGTPELVERWLQQHGSRFQYVRLLTSSSNQGICRNVAKGVAVARGSWIKGIACDDILCEDAIRKFVEQTQRDRTELAFSQIAKFRIEQGQWQALGNLLTNEDQINLIKQSDGLQHAICRENFLPAPSAFYSRRLLESVGGIDTSFKHLDDWPLWLRMLQVVQCVSWIDQALVQYRICDSSVSQKKKTHPLGVMLYADLKLFYKKIRRPQFTRLERWHMDIQMLRQHLTYEWLGNTWIAYRLLRLLQIFSPLAWKLVLTKICDWNPKDFGMLRK